MDNSKSISISVITSTNLKERYKACAETWTKDFKNVYFFGGHIKDENLIPIESAGEDYNSHFLKQQLGFKYMYENNPDSDWYATVGCDAIVYKERALSMLSQYDRNEDFIIGQANCYWTDDPFVRQLEYVEGYPFDEKYIQLLKNPRVFRALAGGGPIFISNSLMKKCHGIIDEFNSHWKKISGYNYPYSDVALPYMVKLYFGVDVTFIPNILSQRPEHYESALQGADHMKHYKNYPISLDEALSNPISFHYIEPFEMEETYKKYKN